MFWLQALLLLEEMASVVLTPFVLYFSLPKCAPAITRFVRDFTTSVDGVGNICSLSAFDFSRHGNSKYGSPLQAPKVWALFFPGTYPELTPKS
jgi:autophagy-related protein 9